MSNTYRVRTIVKELSKILDSTEWDVRRYSDRIGLCNAGWNETAEKVLIRRFPPIHDPPKLVINPGITTDRGGNILLWFLPGILTPERSVRRRGQVVIYYPT